MTEVSAVSSRLVKGFIEEDDSTDVLLKSWGCEEKLSVVSPVGLVVLNADLLESSADGAGTLISSEDAKAGSSKLLSILDEFFFVTFLL